MRHYGWLKTNNGLIDNLGIQFEKIVRGCNQASKESRIRYIQAGERFIKFVAKEFRLQKLQNINDKHIEAWAKYRIEKGDEGKYIKTDLSAIRFWHRQIPQTRFQLTESRKSNKRVGLGSTPDGRSDRAWTKREMEEMTAIAKEKDKPEYAMAIEAIYYTGMRLDETASLRRHEVEEAKRTGILSLANTKGGRPRKVVLTDEGIRILDEAIRGVPRGKYVFCPAGIEVHAFKKSLQKFIYENRANVQDKDRKSTAHNLEPGERGALSIHGARHSYTRRELERLKKEGFSEKRARDILAEELGHGRPQVTRIYTGGK